MTRIATQRAITPERECIGGPRAVQDTEPADVCIACGSLINASVSMYLQWDEEEIRRVVAHDVS